MTDLAVPAQQTDLDPAEARQMNALWKLAQRFAKSSLVPSELRNQPESVMLLLSYGQSIGLAPAHSLPPNLWIIQGRVEPSAQVRIGVAMSQGHEVICEETSSERCTIAVRRAGSDKWQSVTYTRADAERAGAFEEWVERWVKTDSGKSYKQVHVLGTEPVPPWAKKEIENGNVKRKDVWARFTDDMLFAATARRATKRFTPDAFLGIQAPTALSEERAPGVPLRYDAIDFEPHPGDVGGGEAHEQHGAVAEGPHADIEDAVVVEPEQTSEPATEAEAATEADGESPSQPAQSPPEPFPDTEPKAGPAFSRGFAIACTEAGIEDDGRHALIAYATGGRTRTSTEVRRGAEAQACFAALESVKAERLAFTTDDDGELVVEDKEAQA